MESQLVVVQYHQVWVYTRTCTVHSTVQYSTVQYSTGLGVDPHLAQQRRAGGGVAGDRGVEQLGRVHRQVAVLLLHLTPRGVFSFTNTVMNYF